MEMLALKSGVDYRTFRFIFGTDKLSYKASHNLWKKLSTGVSKKHLNLESVEGVLIYNFEYSNGKYCYFPEFWFEEVRYSDIEWE
jgi:hypothetical protein|nr:MAG TPA: hypothetical protein [Caudoviricetes sp.]